MMFKTVEELSIMHKWLKKYSMFNKCPVITTNLDQVVKQFLLLNKTYCYLTIKIENDGDYITITHKESRK